MPIRTAVGAMIVGLLMLSGCKTARTGTTVEDAGESQSQPAFTEVPIPVSIFAITIWPPLSSEPVAGLTDPAGHTDHDDRDTNHWRWASVPERAHSNWQAPRPDLSDYFENWQPTPADVRNMLEDPRIVTKGQWRRNSHVLSGHRMGWLILNDGRCVQWMMKPGGFGWLRASTGEMIYLLHSVR